MADLNQFLNQAKLSKACLKIPKAVLYKMPQRGLSFVVQNSLRDQAFAIFYRLDCVDRRFFPAYCESQWRLSLQG